MSARLDAGEACTDGTISTRCGALVLVCGVSPIVRAVERPAAPIRPVLDDYHCVDSPSPVTGGRSA